MEDNIVLVAISATVRLVGKMKLIKESKRDYLHCTILSTKQTEISTKPFHEACSSWLNKLQDFQKIPLYLSSSFVVMV